MCVKETERENSLLIVNYTNQRNSDMEIKGGHAVEKIEATGETM